MAIIYAGVRSGIERVSKFMMPILVVLSLIIMIYSITRPGAMAGVKYFLVPNVKNFSWMTVVAAMGQMFAFSGGDPDALKAGPSLMFITIPKMFESMGLSTVVGILFFTLVLFAALTSSIALTESAVSTFEDEFGWGRKKSTIILGGIMIVLGSLGMQFLDFFDFLTNSVMMPIAAFATCILVSKIIGLKKIEEEVLHGEGTFRRKKIFNFMIKYLCPLFAAIILLSSIANAFGWITI